MLYGAALIFPRVTHKTARSEGKKIFSQNLLARARPSRINKSISIQRAFRRSLASSLFNGKAEPRYSSTAGIKALCDVDRRPPLVNQPHLVPNPVPPAVLMFVSLYFDLDAR